MHCTVDSLLLPLDHVNDMLKQQLCHSQSAHARAPMLALKQQTDILWP